MNLFNPSAATAHENANIPVRVLIFDDDADLSRTIAAIVRKLGGDPRCVSTLDEMSKTCGGWSPDVALIDLMMPENDGIDVLDNLGQLCTPAAIYVMTGVDDRTLKAASQVIAMSGVEVVDFLRKPLGVERLREILLRHRETTGSVPSPTRGEGESAGLSKADFSAAVRDGEIVPYFQPIMHCPTGALKGFEALARIPSDSETRFAQEYLDYLVEDEDLAEHLSLTMLRQSLEWAGRKLAPRGLTISLNVTGEVAIGERFRTALDDTCKHFGVERKSVILELSEASLFAMDPTSLRRITQLRLAGYQLSIDDFGTGHSSIARLTGLPFSELKIDKGFCQDLPHSKDARAVVEACCELGRKMDLFVTAEGVETQEAATIVEELGCSALQGFLIARPLSPEDAASFISSKEVQKAANS